MKGVGALVFAGLLGAAWLTSRGDSSNDAEPPTIVVNKPAESPLTINVDSGVDFQAPVFAGIEDTLSGQPTAVGVDLPVLESALLASDPAQPMPGVDSTPLPPPAVVAVRAPAPTKVVPRSSRNVRWVRATARRWVTVRASATHKSRIVAAIGPDTRVQLGEAQGDWRRIRTKGISGWVERGKF